jgi:hypothetical protein
VDGKKLQNQKENKYKVRKTCSAYQDRTKPCWELSKNFCKSGKKSCETCEVFLSAKKEIYSRTKCRKRYYGIQNNNIM